MFYLTILNKRLLQLQKEHSNTPTITAEVSIVGRYTASLHEVEVLESRLFD